MPTAAWFLQNVDLWRQLSELDAVAWVTGAKPLSLPAGTLLPVGEIPLPAVVLVHEGELRVVAKDGEAEVDVGLLGPGDFAGSAEVAAPTPGWGELDSKLLLARDDLDLGLGTHLAAVAGTKLLAFETLDDFDRVSSRTLPGATLGWAGGLLPTKRLAIPVHDLAVRRVATRVAAALLLLADGKGTAWSGRGNIAALAAANLDLVDWELARFAARGWVRPGFLRVRLLDRPALEAQAADLLGRAPEWSPARP